MIGTLKLSVVHPTARVKPPYPSFETGWRESMQMWYQRCDHPEDVEYVLVVHADNWPAFMSQRFASIEFPPWANVQLVLNRGENTGCAQGNAGTWRATGEIIAGNNDDMFPPEHWDTLIREAIPDTSREVVLHCSSGSPSDSRLFIPQIYTRNRAVRLGYGGHPDYESMFADNEYTEHAKMDGVVVDARYINFVHRHPVLGLAKMDKVYEGQNRAEAYRKGNEVFMRRAAAGFPGLHGHGGPMVVRHDVEVPQRVIALCLPGQTFDASYVWGRETLLFHLITRPNGNFQPKLSCGHTTNVYMTRIQLTERVLAMDPEPELALWLDDDNILTPEQFELMLTDLEKDPELDGVVAWCWVFNPEANSGHGAWFISCGDWVGTEDDPYNSRALDPVELTKNPGVRPIGWSGFPCVLMRRRALELAGGANAFMPIVDPRIKFGFSGEDTAWFYRAKEAGLRFAVDTRVKVPHLKKWAVEPPVPQPGVVVREELQKLDYASFAG